MDSPRRSTLCNKKYSSCNSGFGQTYPFGSSETLRGIILATSIHAPARAFSIQGGPPRGEPNKLTRTLVAYEEKLRFLLKFLLLSILFHSSEQMVGRRARRSAMNGWLDTMIKTREMVRLCLRKQSPETLIFFAFG